jgi:alkaline phosphatase
LIAASTTALLFGLGIQVAHAAPAKNVIMFLGDGMGVSEVTIARYYQYGAAGKMNLDKLHYTGFQTTWSLKPGAGPKYLPDYDPDSASTGTMWATGRKTVDERISQGPSRALDVPGLKFKTILEVFKAQGKRVGNVSTAEITDATPAVLDSHISLRGCQAPKDMTSCPLETKTKGGLGSIAEQTVDHHVDVVFGGGKGRFDETGGLISGGVDNNKTVVQSAQRQGYKFIAKTGQLLGLTSKDLPVLGLFNAGNMTTEWTGPQAIPGDGVKAHACATNNRPATEPALPVMTKKAIELLENPNGFFLQVEGASIDKQDHAANACAQIGETVAFDRAIGVALEYQRLHPNTLIIVTADHSHTSQIVAEDSSGTGNPTGYSDNLTTRDGQVMRVTYSTAGGVDLPDAPPSQQHTGAAVPIWAQGPGANAILGTTDHTDLFDIFQSKF